MGKGECSFLKIINEVVIHFKIEKIKEGLVEGMKEMKIGSPLNFDSFTSAVIDCKAYDRITGYIKHAEQCPDLNIIAGGKYDKSIGYYVVPTLVETKNPRDRIMTEEIFGPVLTAYVYEDDAIEETLDIVDSSTAFALTGALFAEDRSFLTHAADRLKMAAGNLYINDKSTGMSNLFLVKKTQCNLPNFVYIFKNLHRCCGRTTAFWWESIVGFVNKLKATIISKK